MVSLSFHPPAYTGWYEKSQHLRSAVCGDNDAGQQRVFFTSLDNVFLLCRRFAINATHFICFDEQILIDGLQLRHRSRLGRLFDDRARIPFAPNESDWDLVSSRVHRLHSSRMRVIAYLSLIHILLFGCHLCKKFWPPAFNSASGQNFVYCLWIALDTRCKSIMSIFLKVLV